MSRPVGVRADARLNPIADLMVRLSCALGILAALYEKHHWLWVRSSLI